MPHEQDEQPEQPQQPQQPQPTQMSRARRALKLGMLPAMDMVAHAKTISATPHDDAPPRIFADALADHGDPREHIVRGHLLRPRRIGDNRRPRPPGTEHGTGEYNHTESSTRYLEDGGYMYMAPHKTEDKYYVGWNPSAIHTSADAGPFAAVIPGDVAREIAEQHNMVSRRHIPSHLNPQQQPTQTSMLGRLRRAIQLRRRPLKLNAADPEAMHKWLAEKPMDKGRWAVVADHHLDSGKPALYKLFRKMADEMSPYHNGLPIAGVGPTREGYIPYPHRASLKHGIALGMSGRTPYEILATDHSPDSGYHVRVLAPGRTHTIGLVNVTHEHAKELFDEMDFMHDSWKPTANHFRQHLETATPRPQGPEELSRRGKPLRLMLDIKPFVKAAIAGNNDDAPHLVMSDKLEDHGDPRAEMVRETVTRGRVNYGSDHRPFISPLDSYKNTSSFHPDTQQDTSTMYLKDGGWASVHWNKGGTHGYVRWIPSVAAWNSTAKAPDYGTLVPKDKADEYLNFFRGMQIPYDRHIHDTTGGGGYGEIPT